MTGITNERLDEHGGTHWPFAEGDDQPTLRRYLDGVFPTPSGKARFSTAVLRGDRPRRPTPSTR